MEKKEFKIKQITNNNMMEYKLIGTFDIDNGVIDYIENDELHTRMQFDLKKKLLIRENDMLLLINPLEENKITNGKILIKELNQNITLPIQTNKLEITDNHVILEYKLIDSNELIVYEINF